MNNIIRLLFIGLVASFLLGCVSPKPTPAPKPETPTSSLPGKTKQCGGIQGLACGSGEYCNTGIGACGVADALGTCTAKTPFCTKEYFPVCGCDGKTYGNKCTAGAAGVSIDYIGQCK